MFFIIKRKKFILFFILCILICSIVYFIFNIISEKTILVSAFEEESLQDKISNLMDGDEKIAYLTFDDGPTSKSTPKILKILSEENVKATFFVIGKHVNQNPELVKQAYNDGHYIANHGYSHNNNKLYSSSDNFINEIKSTDLEISKAIGIDDYSSHIFRFPNGYMASAFKSQKQQYAKLLNDINYAYIDWNCLNKDSEKKYTNSELLNNLKNSCKDKGTLVILMHDTSDVNETDLVLKDSIDYLKKEGYIFKNFYDF